MRERALLLLRAVVVAALRVGGEEAAERDHGPGGGELRVATGRRRRAQPERDRQAAGVRPLRGARPFPDQVVEGELAPVRPPCELLRRAEGITGRADRLVRLLGVLDLARVLARLLRDRVGAVEL